MASKFGDLDIMGALGKPEGAEKSPGKGKGSKLLASKPPELQAHLRDAIDPSLSSDERAEALCRAIEFRGEDTIEEDDGEY